ncbi:MAG: GAF domain-containing protein [Candidatus Tectomicrobia bacterium]|uniref:GAF domain-containing protein n=1 Tax=Tectimicrobiota bacterium TaxID=2528274 RepID=A0A932CNV4_UNCTE|nr:GAF domain-containing protein [Candidatus Tectomicrobia bacterium]
MSADRNRTYFDPNRRLPGDRPRVDLNLSPDRVQDLAALAALTLSLSTTSPQGGWESALDILRQAIGAEAAELFLAEPGGRGMVLACHCGSFQHAFFQITRFNPGEGFPGLVLACQEPILTRALLEDPRYLRTRVKEKGFRSCLSVPLCSPQGVMGSLDVAFRRPDADLDRAFRLLSWASIPLAMRLDSSLLRARDVVDACGLDPDGDLEGEFNRMLGEILRQMVRLGEAQGGTLHLLSSQGKGFAWRVREGATATFRCPMLETEPFQACPAVMGGCGVALYGPRKSRPLPCQHSRNPGAVSYCVPLQIGGEAIGLIQTTYQGVGPHPPTRDLVILEKAAEGAARIIHDARRYLEGRRHTERLHHPWFLRGTGPSFPGDLSSPPGPGRSQPEGGQETAPVLEIRCLGPFELYCRGSLITPDRVMRRKALTLLKILLTHDGRPVSKDTLIELLWPEVNPKAGAGRLRVIVHALRQLVEPPEHGGKWVFIQNEGEHYSFYPQAPYHIDVREFKALVELGHRAEDQGDTPTATRAYEAAVQLYRGDFLEDEPFSEWCWAEREQLREACLEVLKRLAGLCVKAGEGERGVKHLRHALRIDPLREEVHRELMRCLWAAGRRDEALRQYEICRGLLERELDISPLPETRQLVQQIRHSPRP